MRALLSASAWCQQGQPPAMQFHMPFIMLHLNRNEAPCANKLSLVARVPILFLPLTESGLKLPSEICRVTALPPNSQKTPTFMHPLNISTGLMFA